MSVDATMTVADGLAALVEVRAWAAGLAAGAGVGAQQLGELELALTEAVSNVLRHAYVDASVRPVELRLVIDDRRIQVVIMDRGEFWDGTGARQPPDDGSGGYGIDLIEQIMDSVERRRRDGGGTELVLVMERTG